MNKSFFFSVVFLLSGVAVAQGYGSQNSFPSTQQDMPYLPSQKSELGGEGVPGQVAHEEAQVIDKSTSLSNSLLAQKPVEQKPDSAEKLGIESKPRKAPQTVPLHVEESVSTTEEAVVTDLETGVLSNKEVKPNDPAVLAPPVEKLEAAPVKEEAKQDVKIAEESKLALGIPPVQVEKKLVQSVVVCTAQGSNGYLFSGWGVTQPIAAQYAFNFCGRFDAFCVLRYCQ